MDGQIKNRYVGGTCDTYKRDDKGLKSRLEWTSHVTVDEKTILKRTLKKQDVECGMESNSG
jgi:hypothetical protein